MTDWVHINIQEIWMGDKGNIGVYCYRKQAINTSNTLGRPSVAAHSPSFLLDASNCSRTQAQATDGRSYLQLPPTSASEGLREENKDTDSLQSLSREFGCWDVSCPLEKMLFFPANHAFILGTRSGVGNYKNSSAFNHYSLVHPFGGLSTPKWTKHPTMFSLHPK